MILLGISPINAIKSTEKCYYCNMKNKYPSRVKKIILTQAPTKAKIKVRLDERTTITIPHMKALKLWKVKFPNAVVIEQ